MVPLYGFLKGDTLGLLILAYEDDSIAQLARKLQQSARTRVPETGEVTVIYNGSELPLHATVRSCGMQALERFDVVRK